MLSNARSLGLAVLMTLLAAPAVAQVALTRGPYLQKATNDGIVIVFGTDVAAEGMVRYASTRGFGWDAEVTSPTGTVHEIQLTGLFPDTVYYYEVVANGDALTNTAKKFRTYPQPNSPRAFRFAAWGDAGVAGAPLDALALNVEIMDPPVDLCVEMGDIVYENGEWENYNPRFFSPLVDVLDRLVLWPTMGNHDVRTGNGAPFLGNFVLPTDSGAPGTTSGTEVYYSFDYGLAHFAALDASGRTNLAVGAPMHQWLAADLDDAIARGKRWLIVFTHNPPYTKGSHDSDVEGDLIIIRNNFVPLIESKGVDLFLAGHSHNYERSYLLQGNAILQNDPSVYSKTGSDAGTVYVVSGCGAKSGGGPLDHPLMAYSQGGLNGCSVFDVSHDELRGYFLGRFGNAIDHFVIRKGADGRRPNVRNVTAGPASQEVTVVFDEPVESGVGPNGAENAANYGLNFGLSVNSATLLSDLRSVRLSTSTVPANLPLLLSVASVRDRDASPLAVAADTSAVLLKAEFPVDNFPPIARIDTDVQSGNRPLTVAFSSSRSSDVDGSVAGVVWHFGDGDTLVMDAETEHTFTRNGEFVVTLVATDDDGTRSLVRKTIHVHSLGSAPVSRITADATSIDEGDTVSLDGTTSLDPDGGALLYSWDFGDPASGDNNTSSDPSPTHAYATEGAYSVRLVVTDDEGAQQADEETILVGDVPAPDGGNDGGGSDSGGGCFGPIGDGPRRGDPSFIVCMLLVAGALALRCGRAGARSASLF